MGEEQEKVGPASNPSSWLSSSSIVRCTSESPPPDPRALPIESTSQEGHCEQSLHRRHQMHKNKKTANRNNLDSAHTTIQRAVSNHERSARAYTPSEIEPRFAV